MMSSTGTHNNNTKKKALTKLNNKTLIVFDKRKLGVSKKNGTKITNHSLKKE